MSLELEGFDFEEPSFDDDDKPVDMSWVEWRKLKREHEMGARVPKRPKREHSVLDTLEDSALGKFKRKVLGINSASDLVPSKSTTGACCCCLGTGGCCILICLILLLFTAIGFALSHKELFLL